MKKNDNFTAYLFLLPSIIVIAGFHIIPTVYSWYISMFNWDLISKHKEFVGFANYGKLAVDLDFWKSLFNTVYFALGTIPAGIILAFLIAYGLSKKIKGLNIFRTIYFLPVVTSINAVGMIWLWIYHPDAGILNWLLGLFGVSAQRWLLDPVFALPAVMLMSIWKSLGYNVIIFLVGILSIPREYYEAAEIDGASGFAVFRNVTLPLVMPSVFFVTLISLIGSFQTFTQVYMLTPEGGPLKSTTVLVYYLYKNAFVFFKIGYASAVSFVIFVIIFALTLLQNKYWGERIHYEN
ncbi:MAG: sugar ABC transporter permease [Candidatus Firestonebacteria bacterium]|nr:sugar ABC transporter permease [Candidatus Firestonebacteria bacterium]